MKSSLFILLSLTLLIVSSCATLFNKPYKTVSINVDTPCKLVTEKDTFLINQQERIKFTRKNGGVNFTTIYNDTLKNEYFIPSRVSSTAYWNFAGFGLLGVLVDAFSPKTYSYPHYLNLAPAKKSIEYRTYRPSKQGDLFFNISLPLLNVIDVNMPLTGYHIQGNMMGLGLGLDYYYAPSTFITISGTTVNDFFTLIGTNPYSDFHYTDIRTNYLSITHNHKIKKVTFGYGVTYNRNQFIESNQYDLIPYDTLSTYNSNDYNVTHSEITQSFGLLFNLKVQAGKYLYASFNYRPSILQPGRINPYVFEQYAGFELCYKFKMNNRYISTSTKKVIIPGFFERNFGHLK